MLTEIHSLIKIEDNLLGQGGFGAVFLYKGKALKIVRVDKSNKKKLNGFVEETSYSKSLAEADTDNEHVPGFDGCFIIGTEVSPDMHAIFEKKAPEPAKDPENDSKLVGMSMSSIEKMAQNESKQPPSATFIYIAILMERLGKELADIVRDREPLLDLRDRVSMGQSLGFHLQFMNDQMKLTHCDIKMQNYMLTLLTQKDRQPTFPISLMSLMGPLAEAYSSKVIDFGAVVPYNRPCSVYTVGFVPLDNVLQNGSSLLAKVGSAKNDTFALGTILGHLMSKGTKVDVLGMNIIFHTMINSMFSLENDAYLKEIELNGDQLKNFIDEHGSGAVRQIYIQTLSAKMVEILGKFKPLFIAKWLEMTEQDSLSEPDFMFQVFSAPMNLVVLLQQVYNDQLILVRSERAYNGKLEAIRLMTSLGLTTANFPDFSVSINEYARIDAELMALVVNMLSFDKDVRPAWSVVMDSLGQFKAEADALYQKIVEAATELAPQKKLVPKVEFYKEFLANVQSGKIKIGGKPGGRRRRVLAQVQNDQMQDIERQADVINQAIKDKEKETGLKIDHLATQVEVFQHLNLVPSKSGDDDSQTKSIQKFVI